MGIFDILAVSLSGTCLILSIVSGISAAKAIKRRKIIFQETNKRELDRLDLAARELSKALRDQAIGNRRYARGRAYCQLIKETDNNEKQTSEED